MRDRLIMEIGAATILIEKNNGLTKTYIETLKIKRDNLIDSYLSLIEAQNDKRSVATEAE